MDMVKVDPQLFIKCRLCLEEMGMFQIVPVVQSQIKFCFDIDVDSYDGLPQLICKSCQAILCEFFTVKTKYIHKQQNLKINVKIKHDLAENVTKQAEQEAVSSSQQIESEPDVQTQSSTLSKKKKLSAMSSSLESLHSDKTIVTEKTDKHIPKQKKISWKTNFNKLVTCRICQNTFKKKKHVIRHAQIHKKRFSKYGHILTNCCTVKLNKIDDKPNITGLENAVMYSQDKIIIDRGHVEFNIVYQSKNKTNNTAHIEQLVSEKESDENVGDFTKCDSSEDDVVVKPKKHKNRNRLMSRSSSDDNSLNTCNSTKKTVEIDDTVCINLDDTSNDSATYNPNTNGELNIQTDNLKNVAAIEKTVQSITASCYSKYLKVKPNKQVSNESQLKHKILSLGRKILNKQGFGSTALLRYLENRNLEINWLPSLQNTKNAKETNYVRIFTKQRESKVNEFNCTGWKKVVYDEEHERGNISARGEIDKEADISANKSSELNSMENSAVNNIVLTEKKRDCESEFSKNILNKDSLSNPKQLGKKSTIVETNLNTIAVDMAEKRNSDCNIESALINMEIDDVPNNDICMPIITSTTSLALSKENCIINDNKSSNDTQRTEIDDSTLDVPKIKVKPVTELMSERALCNLNNNLWTINHGPNLYTQNTEQSSQNKNFQVQMPMSAVVIPQKEISVTPVIATNYIILDCVQMPNTKTTSPINYMQTLLQMHGIILQTAELTRDYILLIKYKVLFRQEVLNDPKDIILCLSLFCKNNVYCFKIRDRHQTDIDLKKLTAQWEWEILKTFAGDVSKKLLENAEKVSPEVHKNTNIFLCLLKSINVRMNF